MDKMVLMTIIYLLNLNPILKIVEVEIEIAKAENDFGIGPSKYEIKEQQHSANLRIKLTN